MIDTATIFQVDNDNAVDEELLLAQREDEYEAFFARCADREFGDALYALITQLQELASRRDNPNSKAHVVKVDG